MSNPHLPPELLDLIVDLLHDTGDALESCCPVFKSWIPRTRKHLFSHIEFPPHQDYGPGKRRFQIVSPPPRATPSLSRFAVLRLSRRQMQREEAGFQRFLISFASRCISQWLMATSISYHSSDSRLSSNLSLLHIWPLRPHAFSISSTRFLFSRTFLCPPAIVPRSLKTATTWSWSSPRALPCLPGPWSFLGRIILYHSCCHYQVASISGN